MSEAPISEAQQLALDEFVSDIDVLNALSDSNRQKIIILLGSHLKHGLTVTELVENMSLSQPAVSHHLKILKQVKIVGSTKHGLQNTYHLTLDNTLEKLERLVALIRASLQNIED
ncbi:ArsR/SmtB family transcription factor [Pediococcus argentinicus]|nr:metalloregulator ArsR/SmtB family transcription factor [Pediococcus argentinicus]NKZ22660.1 winged helix-turn-helix transcriptional regulator [Pediococcus argentinicus]GEP19700.1 transcriptional regulator [Pediococcus argentinicus]